MSTKMKTKMKIVGEGIGTINEHDICCLPEDMCYKYVIHKCLICKKIFVIHKLKNIIVPAAPNVNYFESKCQDCLT